MSNLAGISKTLGTKTPVAKVNTSGKGIGVIPTGISKPNTAKPVSAPTKSPGLAVYNAPKKVICVHFDDIYYTFTLCIENDAYSVLEIS